MSGATSAQLAYTIHTRRYGDSSLLIELFTRETGRTACIAKAALRSGAATVHQPFQRYSVELRGRGEVMTLARAEPTGTPCRLQGRVLYCGLYINELLLRLTARQDPFPELFDDYAEALSGLVSGTTVEPVLRAFELRLLQALGLGLNLDEDAGGRPLSPDSRYTYLPGQGFEVASGSHPDSLSGRTVMALRDGRLAGEVELREARRLMRNVLDQHLDGRPLRTRELFR